MVKNLDFFPMFFDVKNQLRVEILDHLRVGVGGDIDQTVNNSAHAIRR